MTKALLELGKDKDYTTWEGLRRFLYLRRRALLMELALVEDELSIERSVKRK